MNTDATPLPERVRPRSLDDVIGQRKLIGPGGSLRRAVDAGRLPSMILWGPPGVGKTTLALLLAEAVNRPFVALSAINSGVKEIREVLGRPGMFPPVVFIDEIHRFNKSQQDALLGAVEKGQITLVGATTENPSFEVNGALLSRSQVYILESLSRDELVQLVDRAIANDRFLQIETHQGRVVRRAMLRLSGGDGRKLLNLLELVASAHVSADPLTHYRRGGDDRGAAEHCPVR